MDWYKMGSYLSRIFVLAATLLFVAAVVGRILDRSIFGYEPGRLIEFAAMFLLPVVVQLVGHRRG